MPQITLTQTVLPIFPPPGSLVRVPAEGGGYVVTWTMGEAKTVGGVIVIRCVGAGNVRAQEVRQIARR